MLMGYCIIDEVNGDLKKREIDVIIIFNELFLGFLVKILKITCQNINSEPRNVKSDLTIDPACSGIKSEGF